MSATRPTTRQVPTRDVELSWDPIVVDLTVSELMLELDPQLLLASSK